MCGRFTLLSPPKALQELFRTANGLQFPPRYNIAPTQPVLFIHKVEGHREMGLARWGLVPVWVKDPREFSLLINARAETMLDKPSFKGSMRHHRCIVPADGYYEWRVGPGGKKQPFYITRADGRPMALAGLTSDWMGATGEQVETLALVTVAASPDMKFIHDRMPAILKGEDAIEGWLDTSAGTASAAAKARQLCLPLPEGTLKAHPVSTRVSSASADGPDLIAPLGEDAPPKPAAKPAGEPDQLDLF